MTEVIVEQLTGSVKYIARAVLQTPSSFFFFNSVSHLFVQISSKHLHYQTVWGTWCFGIMFNSFHLSHVRYHVSRVICQMSNFSSADPTVRLLEIEVWNRDCYLAEFSCPQSSPVCLHIFLLIFNLLVWCL